MPRSVHCQISDRTDGLFDVVATIAPDRTFRREGFRSLTEAEAWIEGLRVLMTALGAPVLRSEPAPGSRHPIGVAEPEHAIGRIAPRA